MSLLVRLSITPVVGTHSNGPTGNSQGNVILFEPTTSEHISARTIDQIPITALAPAADCRTYAIGYLPGFVPFGNCCSNFILDFQTVPS